MFTAALFTIAKLGNSQDAPLLMNVLRKCGIHSRILLSHKEEGNFVI
jgi:hypothetical protein